MSGWTWLKQTSRAHPHVVDGVLAAVLFVISLCETLVLPVPREQSPAVPVPPFTPASAALAAAICAALAVRRSRPRAALAVIVCLTAVYARFLGGTGALDLAWVISLGTVAARHHRRVALAAGAATAGVLIASGPSPIGDGGLSVEASGQLTLAAAAVAVGSALRNRRAYVAAIEERARRAEETREEEARRAVMEERLRIARELHDVLAHQIALINVQAQVAEHVLDTAPDQAREALGHVRRAGREALGELRTTVGLLRRPGGEDEPPGELLCQPAPGLDRLPDLAQSFAAAGLEVDWSVETAEHPLPAPIALTAFRVVQEALTNVSKHASGARARVRIAYEPDTLTVEITDDGGSPRPQNRPQPRTQQQNQPQPHPQDRDRSHPQDRDRDQPQDQDQDRAQGPGHGLIGMRERTLSVGGVFAAGPEPGGGFRVRAVIPLPAERLEGAA
ncbi:signal transduction histidine kinase [Thermocatellispora tengchongensis]|uniref:histidine kinase n=1 Tax=Thermocatellispora tengchongensis TaxID=1073253 RepID=A0A840P4Y1_9ACTN|nr:sensor histidine kinase [Thermocatellispora tengchongensis]MBB5132963.1 signal transduction histidine kinase [Thermocatellispora tengchongensis]